MPVEKNSMTMPFDCNCR